MRTIQMDETKVTTCIELARDAANFVQTGLNCQLSNNSFAGFSAPIIFNIALACELFLKSIFANAEGFIYNEHNLKNIFDRLKPDVKAEIENNYQYMQTNDPELEWNIKKIYESNPNANLSFSHNLDVCKLMFEKYRYAFENIEKIQLNNEHNIYYAFFLSFAYALDKYIQNNKIIQE